ncbi:MAG: helix-hairpin-helix domain-containing protein [Bacteroidia bacterium]|nr:helix-hairpin-helix domain-containing protein [Bacteroidia bacterium]
MKTNGLLRLFLPLFFFLLELNTGFAQVDSVKNEENFPAESLSPVIEDLVSHSEVEEEMDFSWFTDILEEFARKKLDINTASREQLLLLPGMNELIINRLHDYIETFGSFVSLYELQAVPGLSIEEIRPWLPFIVVRKIGEKDISPGTEHASGPGFREAFQNLEYELTQRTGFLLEKQKGFSRGDTSETTSYRGSPARLYTRFRARYGRNVSFTLTGEKDPGEKWEWKPSHRVYGYDFVSGHLAISGYGNLKNLVVGDYNLSFGQGLVLSRGVGFGKGATVINSVKMTGKGVQPYSSVNENQFMRGVAATFAWKKLYFTAFFSRLNLDATVQQTDTLTADNLLISGIRLGGLHRTNAEMDARKSLKETISGSRFEYQARKLRMGLTAYFQQFDGQISKPFNSYNQFDFRGDHNTLYAVDFDRVVRNFNFFGEIARSSSGGMGGVMGFMSSLAPSVDLSVVVRHFDRDFHSDKGYVFAERPTALQNETGVYMGFQITPRNRWTLNIYFDQFYFIWNRYQADYPSRGWEFLSQIEYKPSRNTWVYLRFRTDNKEANASEYPSGQQVRFLVPVSKTQLRLHFQTRINRDITYRTRMEMVWYSEATTPAKAGLMLYQDISWKLGYKWKLTGRYALFDTPDYDTRVYAYENDVLGFSSIPPYYQTGSRYYVIVGWKPHPKLDLWVRVAQTRLWKTDGIGTGLDEILGPSKTEVKFQLRLRF